MTYIDFLTVTLTAFCALLALLAIVIGLAAIWGYIGLRDEITKAVTARAQQDLEAKLREYPAAQDMIGLLAEIREFHEQQKQLAAKLVSEPGSKAAPRTSKQSSGRSSSGALARKYPGKGVSDV